MATDHAVSEEPEDAESEPAGPAFDYACPQCGDRLQQYAESCPSCGADLGEEFSVSYRVSMPRAGRRIAVGALIGLLILVLLLLAGLLSQLLATAPPSAAG